MGGRMLCAHSSNSLAECEMLISSLEEIDVNLPLVQGYRQNQGFGEEIKIRENLNVHE